MRFFNICLNFVDDFRGFYIFENKKLNNDKFLKFLLFFTVIIPLGVVAVYGISLYGRVSKKTDVSSQDQTIQTVATKSHKKDKIIDEAKENYEIIQTEESKKERNYTGDLDDAQKGKLRTAWNEDDLLQISFLEFPSFYVSIEREDIFLREGVIVNAANTHLGGGGGIDGAIHSKGGFHYKNAHRALQTTYQSKYVRGHAAMIESGLLQEENQIDHVIVVAGPSGESNPQKENELYSCYYNSLILAHHEKKEEIAFPSISTGKFKFPKDRAARISLKAIYDFICAYPETRLKTISIHFLPSEKKSNLEEYEKAISLLGNQGSAESTVEKIDPLVNPLENSSN